MSAQEPKQTGDLSGSLLARLGIGSWIAEKALPDILVAKALQQESPVEEELKQFGLLGSNGPQRPVSAALANDRLTNRVEQKAGGRRFAHHAERLKIAPISRETEFGSPTDIRDTLPHGNPAHARSPVAGGRPADFEPPGVIDGRFDPQYGTLLIVHFDRVLFHPMFDPHAFGPALDVGAGFAAETSVGAATQEPHRVLAREVLNRVVDQGWIDGFQVGLALEQHVGRILAFADGRVVGK